MRVRVRYSDELYHYGIKGQKWGIRRYQNPDGSLTREGKLRYKQENSLARSNMDDASRAYGSYKAAKGIYKKK